MGRRHRVATTAARWLSLGAAGALLGACEGRTPAPARGAAPPGASVDAGRPRAADEAAPGELAEGSEQAFGLPIPRLMAVEARFKDAVHATGKLPSEDVANYVRGRVIAENVETGPWKTVFASATLKAAPAKRLRIEVVRREGTTSLVVRDETPPPIQQGLSPEERMRAVGLTPDGKPLDPTRLE